jgi:hypothetical protein
MGDAIYGQTQPHHRVLNNDSTEITGSIKGKAGQFPVLKLSINTCWDRQGMLNRLRYFFEMLEFTTVDSPSKQMVQIRIIEAKKQFGTVMLAVTADVQKSPPYMVFKQEDDSNGKVPSEYCSNNNNNKVFVCLPTGQ